MLFAWNHYYLKTEPNFNAHVIQLAYFTKYNQYEDSFLRSTQIFCYCIVFI